MLSSIPESCRKSITYDNGSENILHVEINKILNTKSYFCRPYHSWEKGSVENTNGIIRRFFPKGTNFDNISTDDITAIENWLNNRPRKCLNYLTPQEVFNSTVALAP
jgi:IS30 family transposase